MARTAAKFDNHQTFGTFEQPAIDSPQLVSEVSTVIASDKDSERSGEVNITTYKLAENADNPLEAALALYGGSQVDLANAVIAAFNDTNRAKAKSFVVDSIVGPEKVMAKLIKRVAKALNLEEDALKAKVKDNPQYLDMLLQLTK